MHPFDLAHAPGSLTGAPGGNRIVTGYAPFQEFSDTGSAIFPMFPDESPKPSSNPMG